MKASHTFAFALLLIGTVTGTALAKTPDGVPPSLETVCDAETGAAYGLCTAYCEAMDCAVPHSTPFWQPPARASMPTPPSQPPTASAKPSPTNLN